jgi:hypothetical protein
MPTYDTLRPTDIERFWSKVVILGPDDCWLWQAGLNGRGYPFFKLAGRQVRAHHVAFLVANGHPHGSRVLRHTCDTPRCVNPRHLIPGSIADNSRDALERGLYRVGARHPMAKLSETEVRQIRALHARGVSQTELAQVFPVNQRSISNIVLRKTWKHLP